MTHQPIRSVLLDLDNTMIDRAEAFARLFEHWYQILPTPNRPEDRVEFGSRLARRGNGDEPIPDICQDMLDEWPGSFASMAAAVEAHSDMMPKVVGIHPRTIGYG